MTHLSQPSLSSQYRALITVDPRNRNLRISHDHSLITSVTIDHELPCSVKETSLRSPTPRLHQSFTRRRSLSSSESIFEHRISTRLLRLSASLVPLSVLGLEQQPIAEQSQKTDHILSKWCSVDYIARFPKCHESNSPSNLCLLDVGERAHHQSVRRRRQSKAQWMI